MTAKEAIAVLSGDFTGIELKENESHSGLYEEAFNMAKEALEKRVPKKMIKTVKNLFGNERMTNTCPTCGYFLPEYLFEKDEEHIVFCDRCGQAIEVNVDSQPWIRFVDYVTAKECKNTNAYCICIKCERCGRKFDQGIMVDDGGTTVAEEED